MSGSTLIFSSLLTDFGCIQCVAAPTHDAGGLLDVMISRDDGQFDPEVIDVDLSYHRLVRASRFSNVTLLLRDRLHWLHCPERICYKLCDTVFKALHKIAPDYTADLCLP